MDPLLRDPRYRCCCEGMNAPLGAQIFCWIEIVLSVIQLGRFIWASTADSGVPANNYYGIVGAVITIIVAALVLYAVKKKNRLLIQPHMAWLIVNTVVMLIVGITSTALFSNVSVAPTEDGKEVQVPIYTYLWIGFVVGFLIHLAIAIWVFVVLLKTYRYFMAKSLEKLHQTQTTVLPYAEYTVTAGQPQGYPPPTAKVITEQQEKFL